MSSEFEDDDWIDTEAEEIAEPKKDQLSDLCDAFDYDPIEFKKEMQKKAAQSPKMTRFEEDAISTGFEHMASNEINQLGLGPKILELKRKGYTLKAIAERYSLSETAVRKWWATFQELAPKQKQVFAKVMNENSVFNITQQLEVAFKNLNEMAESIKDNPELWIQSYPQVLATLKFAKDITTTMELEKKREREVEIILEELRKEDPKIAMRIIKRLQQDKATRDMLGG